MTLPPATPDPHAVTSLAALRAVIPEPNPVVQRKIFDRLDAFARRFIAESPLVVVSTVDAGFRLDTSPKGDAPGFVQVEDDRTLWIPERPGNRLACGFRNLLETGAIGLIFLVPGVTETLRVNGVARLTRDPERLAQFPANGRAALLCTRVTVAECFFHCGKALIRSKLWQAAGGPRAAADAMVEQFSAGLGVEEAAYRARRDADYRDNL